MRSSVPSRDTMEQIIKFGISNYLQLCVEARFSQIQSQLKYQQCFNLLMCVQYTHSAWFLDG